MQNLQSQMAGLQFSQPSPQFAMAYPEQQQANLRQNMPQQHVYQYSGWSWEVPGSNNPLAWVTEAISHLTDNPASFDDIMHSLVAALNRVVHDENIVNAIVEMLFEQSVVNSNFHYTGARICNHFAHNFGRHFTFRSFRNSLLYRCQMEHEKRNDLMNSHETQKRLIGFTVFMGELLLNLTDQSGDKIELLAVAIQDILVTLTAGQDEACLKCAVQVLKLTGAIISDIAQKQKPNSIPLEGLFGKLKDRLVDESLSRNIKAMLLSVVELRAHNWGRKEGEGTDVTQNGTQQTPSDSAPSLAPVFYDSNGQPLPYEAAEYLSEEYYENYWAPGEEYPDIYGQDDPFDDEMAAAYEKYLEETGADRYNSTY